jgi:hypothetical protein
MLRDELDKEFRSRAPKTRSKVEIFLATLPKKQAAEWRQILIGVEYSNRQIAAVLARRGVVCSLTAIQNIRARYRDAPPGR